MRTMLKLELSAVALAAVVGSAASAPPSYAGGLAPGGESATLDKTGTSGRTGNNVGPQLCVPEDVARRFSFRAEGMGFEPTTPFGAPDFESGRWPIRLPSNGL